jgi:uncharacterized repeat protein (TIGR03837 family)
VEGYHLLPSLLAEPYLKKYYFMPGFTEATGGVILNSAIERDKQAALSKAAAAVSGRAAACGLPVSDPWSLCTGTVFTYVKGFDDLLRDLDALRRQTVLFVLGDKSQTGMDATLGRLGVGEPGAAYRRYRDIHIVAMLPLSQEQYDALLYLTDFNLVRGEDSLVRAICAGKPFVWHAYIQERKYHRVKVEAFIDKMKDFFADESAFVAWSALMRSVNDGDAESDSPSVSESYLPFFENLSKIRRSAAAMSYFMHRRCDLIRKFSGFLEGI